MTLLREAIGESLRRARIAQSRTLREVSTSARVSLGYLSEVERGRKEASSELLAAICQALDLPLSRVLSDVSSAMADADGVAPVPASPQVAPAPEAAPAEAAVASATAVPLGAIAGDTRIVIPAPRAEKLVLVQAK
ncbi:transcriptional regulator with XRE-family HTH domain [Nocardia transvalensis]|uniref:Transcriptional regulator with XRE-family HTH domain n=1 Tax=Nocardia transvalensis TaxID=37333 RepID=A0A7W9UFP0_9NOCA|nr:helix-turn-helix transcriptional regulator [Nocardia transvalensis]MBB5911404.1 transcriptional regulator with XRE-family HTH domain [Nocardia transvalensis]